MRLKDLPPEVDRLSGFDALIATLRAPPSRANAAVDGAAGPAGALFIARMIQRLARPLLIVTYQQERAQRLMDDLTQYGVPQDQLALLPSAPTLFLEGDVTDYRLLGERLAALVMLATASPCVIVTTPEGLLQRTSAPADIVPFVFSIAVGDTLDLARIARGLVEMGYQPAGPVTQPGEFGRRGGILDIFPSTADAPVRIELLGDEVESIRPFDVATQRSTGRVDCVALAPAREIRLTESRVNHAIAEIRNALALRIKAFAREGVRGAREAIDRLAERIEADLAALSQRAYFNGMEQYLTYLVPEAACAADYLPDDGVVVLDDPGQIRNHWERFLDEARASRKRHIDRGEGLDEAPPFCAFEPALLRVTERPTLEMSSLAGTRTGRSIDHSLSVQSGPVGFYRGHTNLLADDVGAWLENDCRVVFVTDQPNRVREFCLELDLPVKPVDAGFGGRGVHIVDGRLSAGFSLADLRLYVLTDAELFGTARSPITGRKVAGGIAISSVLDLREGDHVVHIHHGVGLYRGLVQQAENGVKRDYLLVQYLGGDRLYIPADQIDRVQRYAGASGSPPPLNRIGGSEWLRTTRRARAQAREMAGELIHLYAARHAADRPALGPDTPWQTEMEDSFPFEMTAGQAAAIRDIKADLDLHQPMDRLICGDVGFGKTEVALRAAFKVVMGGQQVAVLCPTTVLAAQHIATITERLAAYPVRIELLSRFRSRSEQARTVRGLKQGAVDIVVGTHRLLSKDVVFKNLGLVIVDEEQRFGVAHKERLKQLRTSVDVITLTATPIPRTLSMALSGLRDMSVIADPPEGRIPVLTYVREYDDELVRDAILRELEREGQVYFVHNRIESIEHVAQHLRRLTPDARIAIAHGQMSEDELEQVMVDFYHHRSDILVCTTIVENGLDIPRVNTLIVDSADHLGLAQLYQLRGRVGRSSRQAYAYLMFRRHKQLTEPAEQRLTAIKEFATLGSGYRVALRDMEIRGAGNLLGPEQHGAMISVGFDLYSQLLAQAVQELKGEAAVEDILPSVDLPVPAHIPAEYIQGEAERIYFYKRMANVRSVAEIEDLQSELDDRFGDPPRPVWDALAVLRLRVRCKQIGVGSIRVDGGNVSVSLAGHVRLGAQAVHLLTHAFKGHRFTPAGVAVPVKGRDIMEQVEEILDVIERALAFNSREDPGDGQGRRVIPNENRSAEPANLA